MSFNGRMVPTRFGQSLALHSHPPGAYRLMVRTFGPARPHFYEVKFALERVEGRDAVWDLGAREELVGLMKRYVFSLTAPDWRDEGPSRVYALLDGGLAAYSSREFALDGRKLWIDASHFMAVPTFKRAAQSQPV